MKLLFMDKKDIFNTWGQIRFGATSLEKIADTEHPVPPLNRSIQPEFFPTIKVIGRTMTSLYGVVFLAMTGHGQSMPVTAGEATRPGRSTAFARRMVFICSTRRRCTRARREDGHKRPR